MKVNLKAPAEVKDKVELDGHSAVQFLKTVSPLEAGPYIENNVTDLSSAKNALKWMAIILCYIVRRIIK